MGMALAEVPAAVCRAGRRRAANMRVGAREAGGHAEAGRILGRAERLDLDAVVGAAHETALEIGAFEHLVDQRPPLGAVGRGELRCQRQPIVAFHGIHPAPDSPIWRAGPCHARGCGSRGR
jgi:hypothetical protein